MATFGPDLPPRTGHHELQVLDVHFARRAQRRLAQNAAAARLETSSALELEEACLDDPPAADVISSDEDISVVETGAKGSKKNRNGAIPTTLNGDAACNPVFQSILGHRIWSKESLLIELSMCVLVFFTKPAANNHQSGLSPSFWVSKSW